MTKIYLIVKYCFISFVVIGIISVSVATFFAYNYINKLTQELPDVSTISQIKLPIPSIIYSRDGEKIGEIFAEKRYLLKYEQIPELIINAFLSAEDSRFFEHRGIDWLGFARASFYYVTKTGNQQGGSTLTQQLAKLLLLSREKTIERKLKDMLLARKIETILAKKQILELYLNTIFLGNNSYGIEAAARNYFRKSVKDLNLAEISIIAGLAPAPSAYAPTEHLNKAKVRQNFVLEQMYKNKKITNEQLKEAKEFSLKIYKAITPNNKVAPFFLTEVKKQLANLYSEEQLEKGGLIIYTSIDMRLQREVQKIIEDSLLPYQERKSFKGVITNYSENNLENAVSDFLNTPVNENEEDKAIVIDVYPELNAIAIVTKEGLGLLLGEEHKWVTSSVKKSNGDYAKFTEIIKKGDLIHVKISNKKNYKKSEKIINKLQKLTMYLSLYKNQSLNNDLKYYEITDYEFMEASALIMHAKTGEILAMIGGANFNKSEFNRATQSRRQVGSSVKPLYYALAIEKDFSPASLIDSPPLVIGNWRPENYEKNEFTGKSTLRRALINSYNVQSIQLFQTIGLEECTNMFNKLGLNWSKEEGGLSLALGSGSASLMQMVQAYSIFPNEGIPKEAYYINKIEDSNAKILSLGGSKDKNLLVLPLKKNEPQNAKNVLSAKDIDYENRIISKQSAFIMTKIMQEIIKYGTGAKAQGVSTEAAGKTGTTNSYTDAWFIGYLPNLVGGIWIGFDNAQKSLGSGATGGKYAAPMWREIMKVAQKYYPTTEKWSEPDDIRWVNINVNTGQLMSGGIAVPVKKGTEPGGFKSRNIIGILGKNGENITNEIGSNSSELRNLE